VITTMAAEGNEMITISNPTTDVTPYFESNIPWAQQSKAFRDDRINEAFWERLPFPLYIFNVERGETSNCNEDLFLFP